MFVFAGQNEGQNGYSELSEAALTRLKSSLRPGSRANYITYFSTFLQFLHVFNITLHNIHQSHVISYIEWLAMSGLAYPTICNYLSGVKFYINYHSLNILPFQHSQVGKMLVACSRALPSRRYTKHIFTVSIMHSIINAAGGTSQPTLYISLFLLSFFGFFRISNLLPASPPQFSPLHHLARGDIIFTPSGAQVLLKWSKTLQSTSTSKIIHIPHIPGSPLCPVYHLKLFLRANPLPHNSPFFAYSQGSILHIVTHKQARARLREILLSIGLNPTHYSFHTFRHSGATLAFQLGVPLQDIQSHGTWASSAVWQYTSSATTSNVAHALHNNLSTTTLGLGSAGGANLC